MVGLCQTNVWEKASSTPINIIKDGVALSGTNLAIVVNDHFLSIKVCHKLLKVKPFQLHGLDSIPNRIIKEFAYKLAEPVCTIFNESLSSSIIPSDWKDASITPIPTTQSVCCEDELCPIALIALIAYAYPRSLKTSS
jgi:hypothetical protein